MHVNNEDSILIKHGKESKQSKGYYYEGPRGQQLYRNREETYQQKRSPRQRWCALAFTFAHRQICQIWNDPEQIKQVTAEWKEAHRIGPNNQTYPDAKGWKFANLLIQWKMDNPFEAWYEQYLAEISQKAQEKTSTEEVSDYMLRHQAEILEAQAAALRAQLKARHN